VLDALQPLQIAHDLLHRRLGGAVEDSGAAFFVPLNGPEDVAFPGWAHAGKPSDAVLPGSRLQVVEAGYSELLVKHGDRLGAEAGDLEELGQARRGFGQQLLMGLYLSGLQVLLDLGGDGLSHAGDGLQPPLLADFDDVLL